MDHQECKTPDITAPTAKPTSGEPNSPHLLKTTVANSVVPSMPQKGPINAELDLPPLAPKTKRKHQCEEKTVDLKPLKLSKISTDTPPTPTLMDAAFSICERLGVDTSRLNESMHSYNDLNVVVQSLLADHRRKNKPPAPVYKGVSESWGNWRSGESVSESWGNWRSGESVSESWGNWRSGKSVSESWGTNWRSGKSVSESWKNYPAPLRNHLSESLGKPGGWKMIDDGVDELYGIALRNGEYGYNAGVQTEYALLNRLGGFCPVCCENSLKSSPPNASWSDYYCPDCHNHFEVKTKFGQINADYGMGHGSWKGWLEVNDYCERPYVIVVDSTPKTHDICGRPRVVMFGPDEYRVKHWGTSAYIFPKDISLYM
jgi:hypothetical protein